MLLSVTHSGLNARVYTKKIKLTHEIFHVIVQQIVLLSKYGHDALDMSSVGNRYPAVYVASYVLNVTTVPFEIKFTRPFYHKI